MSEVGTKLDLARAYIDMGDPRRSQHPRGSAQGRQPGPAQAGGETARRVALSGGPRLSVQDAADCGRHRVRRLGLPGWQHQAHARSVQGELERALARVASHRREPDGRRPHRRGRARVPAGRAFRHRCRPPRATPGSWAALLPRPTTSPSCGPARCRGISTHARGALAFLPLSRPQRRMRPALERQRMYWVRRPLDADAMHAAAQGLIGEHDFTSFRARNASRARRCGASPSWGSLGVAKSWSDGAANAFLHHMVRNIVGSLLQVGAANARSNGCARCSKHAIAPGPGPPRRPRDCISPRSSIRRSSAAVRPCASGRLAAIPREIRRDLVREDHAVPRQDGTPHPLRPGGVVVKCPACDAVLYRAELERNLQVCPKCTHHMRIGARDRLVRFLDPSLSRNSPSTSTRGSAQFRDSKKYPTDSRCAEADRRADALVVMAGASKDWRSSPARSSFASSAVDGLGGGRTFVRAAEFCIEQRRPLVCFSSSGGARMQEGLLSLLQMSKTSSALARLAARDCRSSPC